MTTKIMSLGSIIACLFLVGALLQVVSAVDYDVGGDFGWNLPSNTTFFSDWARNKTFFVGDKLVFRSKAGETHDVAEPASEVDFDGCVNPGIVLQTSAVLSITLTATPRRYFICTVGNGNHCNAGMKFAITVFVNPNSALLPPPPPPPSSAPSFRIIDAFLAAALAGLFLFITILP